MQCRTEPIPATAPGRGRCQLFPIMKSPGYALPFDYYPFIRFQTVKETSSKISAEWASVAGFPSAEAVMTPSQHIMFKTVLSDLPP